MFVFHVSNVKHKQLYIYSTGTHSDIETSNRHHNLTLRIHNHIMQSTWQRHSEYMYKIVNRKMDASGTRNSTFFLAVFLWTGIVVAVASHNENLESLYPGYKLIKDTIESNPKLIFKLKHTFNPSVNYRYWQVDGVEVIPIAINVSFLVQNDIKQTCNVTGKEQQRSYTAHWNFQWTNSLLLNLICGDILLAMDPNVMAFLYSNIVQSHHTRQVRLDLHLNRSLLPCNHTLDELHQAFAFFLSTVSNSTYFNTLLQSIKFSIIVTE